MKYKSEANYVEKKILQRGFYLAYWLFTLLITGGKSLSVVQGIFSTKYVSRNKNKTIQKYIDKYYVEDYDKKIWKK